MMSEGNWQFFKAPVCFENVNQIGCHQLAFFFFFTLYCFYFVLKKDHFPTYGN